MLEWIEVAMGWADAYEKVYKMAPIDRDLVIAALTLTTTATQGVNFAMAGFFVLAAVLAYLGALRLLT